MESSDIVVSQCKVVSIHKYPSRLPMIRVHDNDSNLQNTADRVTPQLFRKKPGPIISA